MKKKWLLLLAISIPCIIFVLTFLFFEYKKRNFAPSISCIDQNSQNISSDIIPILKDACIIQYTNEQTSIHIQLKNTDTLAMSLENNGWNKINDNTYTKGTYTLTWTDSAVVISISTSQNSEATKDQESEPEQVAPPKIADYVISDKEISKIDTTSKIVVFTFDGGSGTQSLSEILSTLTKYHVKGTFFLTGKWAEDNTASVKKIHDNGHEIYNHTYSHPDLATISDSKIKKEFEQADTIISGLTGETTKPFFRPPYGSRNLHIRQLATSLGYQDVYWTIDALDWKESTGTTAQIVKDRILNNLAPGNIYLMHIGDNLTGEVLDEVFSKIIAKGYSILSLYTALTTYN